MTVYTLQIVQKHQTQSVRIGEKGKVVRLSAEEMTAYRIFDAEGRLVALPEMKEAGNDLWVYVGRKAEGTPDLIIKDYLVHYPITDLSYLERIGTTLATSGANNGFAVSMPPPPSAPVVKAAAVGSSELPQGLVIGLSALGAVGAVAGIAAAGGGKGGDSSNSTPPKTSDTSVSTPTVTLNTVADINQANQNGKTTLSGSIANIDDDVVKTVVTVNVGGQNQTATVSDKTWSLEVDNTVLAQQQGDNRISVTATVTDKAGNSATSAAAEQSYHTDTVINRPTLSINTINDVREGQDGITQLSGSLNGVDNDVSTTTVTVHIGGNSRTATVSGNTWTLDVDNRELVALKADPKIRVSATVADKAGNTAESETAEQSYRVEAAPTPPAPPVNPPDTSVSTPTVTLNTVADINQANQNGKTTLSGSIANIDDDVVKTVVTVNIGGQNQTATVSDKTWSLEVDNTVLAQQQGDNRISVTATVTDKAGNSATSTAAEQSYHTDTVINRPTLSINTINDVREGQDGTTQLSGSLNGVDDDVSATTVTVHIGGNSRTATVSGNTWTLDVDNRDLVALKADPKIRVSATVADKAGNTAESETAEQSYRVEAAPTPPAPPVNPPDTSVSTPTVTLNTVADINQANQNGKTTLSGSIANIDDDVVTTVVTVNVGGQNQTATVTDKTWSLEVDNTVLAKQQGDNRISVTATVTDKAGNTATSAAAEQSYQVDTVLSKPTLVIDDIATINHAKLGSTTKLSGSLSQLDDDVNDTVVTVSVGGKNQTAAVSSGRWSVDVAADTLAQKQGSNSLTAAVTVTDKAGNTAMSTATKDYKVDTVISKPVLVIDNIATINRAKLGSTTQLSGSLNGVDDDVSATTVTVHIGSNSRTATVSGNTWTLDVDNRDLVALKADPKIRVSATVADKAGNTAASETVQGSYQVDTELNRPTVSINPIADIKANRPDGITQLSGSLSGVDGDVTATTVTVQIGQQSKTATVNKGSWSLDVSNRELAALTTDPKIRVTAEVRDGAGNTAQSDAAEQGYRVDSTQNIVLKINNITEDNMLNAAEQKTDVTVSGTVSGNDADTVVGKNVTLSVNGQTVSAKVENDFSFSAQVKGSDLLADSDHTVDANLDGVAASKNYEIEADNPLWVRIRSIDGDNVMGADRYPGMIRVEGKLEIPEAHASLNKGFNSNVLKSIDFTLNQINYFAGINPDKTFSVLIPEVEYRKANGKTFSYVINAAEESYNLLKNPGGRYLSNGGGLIEGDYIIESNKFYSLNSGIKVSLQGEGISKVGDNLFRLDSKSLPQSKSVISGEAGGAAKAGDTVVLNLGGVAKYAAKLQDDKTFSVEVDRHYLSSNPGKQVSATLTSAGKTATDTADYLTSKAIGTYKGDLVSRNGKIAADKLPYFIRNLDSAWDKAADEPGIGHLDKNKTGAGKAALTYRFVTQAEIDIMPEVLKELDARIAVADGIQKQVLQAAGQRIQDMLDGNVQTYPDDTKTKIREIFPHIESAVDIKFTEVSGDAEADIVFYLQNMNDADGFAYYGGSVHLNTDSFTKGEFNFTTAIHEIFHSLGMKHPHRDADDPDNTPYMDATEDNKSLTVMSYQPHDFVEKDSMRLFDLAYLHYRYGVNPNFLSGNDIHTFKAFNRSTLGNDIYIWDGGGVDTFDASIERQGVYVNLTPGSWIYSGSKTANFAIAEHKKWGDKDILEGTDGSTLYRLLPYTEANPQGTVLSDTPTVGQAFIGYGTQIENLLGSAYNDELIGNNADNSIYGGDGDDRISGGNGNDWLDGGSGNDTMDGGSGDDVYIVGSSGDTVTEAANGGTADHVYSSIDYTLGNHVEQLTLLGSAINGTGNDADNMLQGNNMDNVLQGGAGNDTIGGGLGKDTLTGGAGRDTFVFSGLLDKHTDVITDFKKDEDTIALSQKTFLGLTKDNLSTYVRYDNDTGKISYDPDGEGGKEAVVFADVGKGLGVLDENHFTLIA